MRISHIVLMLLFSFNLAQSQETFQLRISSTYTDISMNPKEIENGNFVIVGTKYLNFYTISNQFSFIIQVNSKGEIVNEREFKIQDTLFRLTAIEQNSDKSYYAFGSLGSNQKYLEKIIVLKLDNQFNIIKKYLFKIPFDRKNPLFSVLKNNAGNFVCYGSVVQIDKSEAFPFILEISENGELIRQNYEFDTQISTRIFDMIEKKDASGYYVLNDGLIDSNYTAAANVMSLNSKFEVLSHVFIPNSISNTYTLKWHSDTTYLVCGNKAQDTFGKEKKTQDDDIAVAIVDTLGKAIKIKYIGQADAVDISGLYSSLDYSADNLSIYVAGTNDYVYTYFPVTPSKIILSKLDKELNTTWEKFYGGDIYYILMDLMPTSDGGCLLVTNTYNYNKQIEEYDLQIIKVDAQGNLETSIIEPQIETSELFLFANSSNELNIRTAIQHLGGKFYLYDISGRLVKQKKILAVDSQINTSELQNGVYIYKYSFNGEIAEKGKWLKK